MPRTLIRHDRIPLRHLLLFGLLPSPIKKWAYRFLLGYRIGDRVRFALGAVVVGKQVSIGDDCEFGLLSITTGRSIEIGRHSSIGMMSYVSCRRIRIGDDARIREQVSVAGPELPESSFELGSRTVILQRTSINPTKPVTIGDDSGIGGHCLIFTHGAWLNALHGYPVTYKSVTIGRSVWLPWRVFVMPGAEIGDGSVIGANSLVNGTIPPMSLAAGSPAKVLRTAPDFPRAMTDERRRRIVDDILGEFERMVADHGIDVVHEGPDRTFRRDGSNFRLRRVLSEDRPGGIENGDTVLSEVALTEQEKQSYRRSGAYWLDVDAGTRSEGGSALTEELALFLGRYGIRLARE